MTCPKHPKYKKPSKKLAEQICKDFMEDPNFNIIITNPHSNIIMTKIDGVKIDTWLKRKGL
jgi:hypothetical protein